MASSEIGQNGIPLMSDTPEIHSFYDPHDFGKKHLATTFWETVLHIVIISAGPVVYTLPATFLNVGATIGLIGSFFIVCFYAYNVHMFADAEYEICKKKRVPNLSYSDTVFYAFKNGPKSVHFLAPYCRFLTYIPFALTWGAGNAFNLILMGQNLQMVYSLFADDNMSIRLAMLCLSVPLLILCWIPNLKYLVTVSSIGNFLNWLVICAVFYFVAQDRNMYPMPEQTVRLIDIPLFLGSILFCINSTGIMMPLKNNMREPKRFNAPMGVITVSFLGIALLVCIFGTVCSQKYGTSIHNNVLMNLPVKNSIVKLMITVVLLVLCFQFPLVAYVVYDSIWNNILREKKEKFTHKLIWEYVIRTIIVVIILVMALTIPNIQLFLSFTGTIGTSMDSILFPTIVNTLVCYQKTYNSTKFVLMLCKNALMILFALTLITCGVNDCVRQIFAYYNDI